MKEITNGKLKAYINEEGAYLERLSFMDKKIFFDKSHLKDGGSMKVRGGMHVCAPNFSIDKLLNELPAHGFARDLRWDILREDEESLSLTLAGIKSYEDVYFTISYRLSDNKLNTRLKIENKASEDKLIAPAFHPYFNTSFENLTLDDYQIKREDLPGSIFISSPDMTFKTEDFAIKIKGLSNVNTYTLWTDFLDDYVCLEPTFNGVSFSDENLDPFSLGPGQSFIQEFDIIVDEL
ncbi:MAG: aldose epimerase [Anaerococcus sp.]|nr:aldose epimerase [Anaerococcus sp.]